MGNLKTIQTEEVNLEELVQQITFIDIKSIKGNTDNPRTLKDDKFKKLVQSVKEFPEMMLVRPIIVDEDHVVLGGNMRLEACKKLKMTQIPIINVKHFTEKQKERFIIVDNVGFGQWDYEILGNLFDHYDLIDWGFDLPEFDEPLNLDIPKEIKIKITIDPEYKDTEEEVREALNSALEKFNGITLK